MRVEWRLGVAAALALTAGAFFAEPYARLAAPYYATVARLVARMHPWAIQEVAVTADRGGRGSVLRLVGEVRRQRADPKPAAIVVSRVQVGEVIETPLVFWALLLAWPVATARERWTRVGVGAAVFLGVEALTTAAQLMQGMAETSALLVSANAPPTVWERWSGFLEDGGDFALAAAAALATVTVTQAILGRRGVRA